MHIQQQDNMRQIGSCTHKVNVEFTWIVASLFNVVRHAYIKLMQSSYGLSYLYLTSYVIM